MKLTMKSILLTMLTSQLEMSWLKAGAIANCGKGVRLNQGQTMQESKKFNVCRYETYHCTHICDNANVPTGNVLIECRCKEKLWQGVRLNGVHDGYWLKNPNDPNSTTMKLTIRNILVTLLTFQLEMSWLKERAPWNCGKGVRTNRMRTMHHRIKAQRQKISRLSL